jgi:hypothetical protein
MECQPAVLVVPPLASVSRRNHGHREASPPLVLLFSHGTGFIEIVNYLELIHVLEHEILCRPEVFDGGILASRSPYKCTAYAGIKELSDYAVLTVLDREQLFAFLLSGVSANLDREIDQRNDDSDAANEVTEISEYV